MKNKFNIGDKVNGGTIVTIVRPYIFCLRQKYEKAEDYPLNNNFPDWYKKPLYDVKFAEPQCVVSEEEFYQQTNYDRFIKSEDKTAFYQEMVIKRDLITMPEDALCFTPESDQETLQNQSVTQ